jgi:heme oxygenase
LAYLGAKETPRPLAATGHLVKKLDTWAHTSPPALIGVYYVLEGSRMGSMVLAKPLSQSLAVPLKPGCGLDYHIEGLQQRPQQWQAFKERLDSLPLALANKDAIFAAAAATMEGLFDLYAALSDLAIASEREIPDGKQNWALLGAS